MSDNSSNKPSGGVNGPSDELDFIDNPRPLDEAIKCIHLTQGVMLPIKREQVQSGLAVRGFHKGLVIEEATLREFPILQMSCVSEKLFDAVMRRIPAGTIVQLPAKSLRIDNIQTCQLCRYWEKKGG